MNNPSLTALLAEEHRAELLRQAERYRQAYDAKAESHRLPKRAKLLGLAAFRGHIARPVAVSEGIPLATAKTPIRQGPRPPGAQRPRPNGCLSTPSGIFATPFGPHRRGPARSASPSRFLNIFRSRPAIVLSPFDQEHESGK
jgi:hypothetical protein